MSQSLRFAIENPNIIWPIVNRKNESRLGRYFLSSFATYDEEISIYFYLVKGTEIIVPETALIFKWYCAWSYKIEKSKYSLGEKWCKSHYKLDYKLCRVVPYLDTVNPVFNHPGDIFISNTF